jgi:hypothetical protein
MYSVTREKSVGQKLPDTDSSDDDEISNKDAGKMAEG